MIYDEKIRILIKVRIFLPTAALLIWFCRQILSSVVYNDGVK